MGPQPMPVGQWLGIRNGEPCGDLLSHGLPHYHRRSLVSRSCSGWEGVVPRRYGRKAKAMARGQRRRLCPRARFGRGSEGWGVAPVRELTGARGPPSGFKTAAPASRCWNRVGTGDALSVLDARICGSTRGHVPATQGYRIKPYGQLVRLS